jgi:hypothetical protein
VPTMRINLKNLEKRGFESRYDEKSGTVDIWPREHKEITDQLQDLTGLPKRDCYYLQEEIADLQIINAIKETT